MISRVILGLIFGHSRLRPALTVQIASMLPPCMGAGKQDQASRSTPKCVVFGQRLLSIVVVAGGRFFQAYGWQVTGSAAGEPRAVAEEFRPSDPDSVVGSSRAGEPRFSVRRSPASMNSIASRQGSW